MSNQCEFEDELETEEEEAGSLKPQDIAQAVLNSTDWTTQTIISQLKQGNIDLNPRFQRRDAWTTTRKSRLIESLILGLPVPEIVLAERKDKRGKFIILDGKQRLLTLLQFVGEAGESKYNNFKMSALEVRDDLNRKGYADIQIGLQRADFDAFNNSTIRSVVIRNWPNIALLHLIFLRLNTGSVSLSPQELRQALLPGKFIDFVYDRSEKSDMVKKVLGITQPDFRMRDVELLVRYEGFRFFLPDYAGNLRAFLDDTCEKLNNQWDNREKEIKRSVDEFEEAIATMIKIYGEENIARKWTGTGFESRPNRAVLDIMTFYFSNKKILNLSKGKSKAVLNAFKKLCVTDHIFRKSIETTTKSLSATHERLYRWGKVLSEVLSISIKLPRLDKAGRRIEFSGFL